MMLPIPRWRLFAVIIFLAAMLAACASINPFAAAKTIEQQAYAAEATYNVVLQSAADLVTDPAVPQSIKARILSTEERTTPAIAGLSSAVEQYTEIRLAFEEGATTEQRLTYAADNLERWLVTAEKAIADLSAVVDAWRND